MQSLCIIFIQGCSRDAVIMLQSSMTCLVPGSYAQIACHRYLASFRRSIYCAQPLSCQAFIICYLVSNHIEDTGVAITIQKYCWGVVSYCILLEGSGVQSSYSATGGTPEFPQVHYTTYWTNSRIRAYGHRIITPHA